MARQLTVKVPVREVSYEALLEANGGDSLGVPGFVADGPDADRLALQDRLIGAVAQLPPSERAVVTRHGMDRLSHAEIAKELGISEGAAQQRWSRARRALRPLLFDYAPVIFLICVLSSLLIFRPMDYARDIASYYRHSPSCRFSTESDSYSDPGQESGESSADAIPLNYNWTQHRIDVVDVRALFARDPAIGRATVHGVDREFALAIWWESQPPAGQSLADRSNNSSSLHSDTRNYVRNILALRARFAHDSFGRVTAQFALDDCGLDARKAVETLVRSGALVQARLAVIPGDSEWVITTTTRIIGR